MEERMTQQQLLKVLGDFGAAYYRQIAIVVMIAAAIIINNKMQHKEVIQSLYATGISEMNSGKYDDALNDFNKALEQNSNDPASRFGLAWAYQSKGQPDAALNEYATAAQSAFEVAFFSSHNAGVIFQGKGHLDQAVAEYQKALRAKPDAKNSLGNLLLIYDARKQYAPAIQACQSYLAANPKDTNVLYEAGQFAEKMKNTPLAIQYYRTAVALDKNFQPAANRLTKLAR